MKKALAVVLVVALLGLLSGYVLTNDEDNPALTTSAKVNLVDGTFAGADAETPYGNVQISIVISGGKITDVRHLKLPNGDERTREITGFSAPELKANTLKAQSADIDFVSGATSTSYGYQQSLQEALDKANS